MKNIGEQQIESGVRAHVTSIHQIAEKDRMQKKLDVIGGTLIMLAIIVTLAVLGWRHGNTVEAASLTPESKDQAIVDLVNQNEKLVTENRKLIEREAEIFQKFILCTQANRKPKVITLGNGQE
jgi:hypothetical protein